MAYFGLGLGQAWIVFYLVRCSGSPHKQSAPQTILHHKKFSTTIFSSKILSCTVCVLLKGMPEVSVSMCVCSVDCGNGKTNLVLLFVLANLLNICVHLHNYANVNPEMCSI